MERQEILYLLLGLALGVILTSILFLRAPAASERARELGIHTKDQYDAGGEQMSMNAMTEALEHKAGDDFDKAFIELMIEHHEGAVSMAELALKQAGHQEIKDLAKNIIEAQQKEIKDMKAWYMTWDFGTMMPKMMHEEVNMHSY
jgi:Domain of unknown function (DUF305)